MGDWCYMCERQLCLTALECICTDTTKCSDFSQHFDRKVKMKLKNKDLRTWSKYNRVRTVKRELKSGTGHWKNKLKGQDKNNPRREGIKNKNCVMSNPHKESLQARKKSQSQVSRRYMKGWPWRKITVGRTEGVNNIHNRENPKISPDLNHDDKWRPAQQIQNLRIPDYPGTEITGKSCGSPAGEDTPSAADMVGCLPAENNAFFPQDSVLSVPPRFTLQELSHHLGDNTSFLDLLPTTTYYHFITWKQKLSPIKGENKLSPH